MSRRSKRLFILIPIALILGTIVWLLIQQLSIDLNSEPQSKKKGRAQAVVQVASSTRGLIEDRLVLSGSLEAAAIFDLSPNLDGILFSLKAELGSEVQRGQVVAQLVDETYRQELAQAEAALEVAKAQYHEAKSTVGQLQRDSERLNQLVTKKIAAEADSDRAKAALLKAEATVSVAKAQMDLAQSKKDLAQLQWSYCEVKAVWSGNDQTRVVAKRWMDDGQRISKGDPLLTLMDLSNLKAIVHVTEAQYGQLKVNQVAKFSCDAWPNKVFEAHVMRLSPSFATASRQALVELKVPNQEHLLKPGMFVRVELVLKQDPQALLVPLEALVSRNGQPTLYHLDKVNSKVHKVPVQVGMRHESLVQILAPAIEGEVVVLGQHLIKDGDSVTVIRSQQE